MKIRFDHPATVRIDFKPGDELTVQTVTSAIEALVKAPRPDGQLVARVVGDGEDELAVAVSHSETRGRRAARPETLSR